MLLTADASACPVGLTLEPAATLDTDPRLVEWAMGPRELDSDVDGEITAGTGGFETLGLGPFATGWF